jgi:hypothetical protein
MNEDARGSSVLETLVADWIKSSGEFWKASLKKTQAPGTSETTCEEGAKNRFAESLETTIKRWQSVSSTLSDPQMADAILRGINTLPEFFLTLARTGWEASSRIQQQAMEKAGKIGQKTEAYKFENLDQEVFKAWKEIYEEEFQQYFQIPQLGLLRYYQERFNRFLDQSNLLQATLSEFLFILYLPMEKSIKVLQDKVEEMSRNGTLPEKSKEYYNLWLKILEGHYMTLFKSPEYLQALGETLNQLEAFSVARNQFLQDVLQQLPVPTNRDMDDLYKELHLLKKKVRNMERQMDEMRQGAGFTTAV